MAGRPLFAPRRLTAFPPAPDGDRCSVMPSSLSPMIEDGDMTMARSHRRVPTLRVRPRYKFARASVPVRPTVQRDEPSGRCSKEASTSISFARTCLITVPAQADEVHALRLSRDGAM
jgi:hypothetical protein